jgi:single-stranded-DNA-specific exonuclease
LRVLLSTDVKVPTALFLWDERWSPALVGLVAGKLVERYARPVVVVGAHAGQWIGSGRSIPAYDVTTALRSIGDGILARVGGHAQACGFALNDGARLAELGERLRGHAQTALEHENLMPTIVVDLEIPLEAVDLPLAESLDRLAPFGEGNRRPMFVSRAVRLVTADVMGSAKNHLRLTLVTARGRRLKALGFKMGERVIELAVGQALDVAYTVAVNEWNGVRSAECHLVDFQVCSSSFVPMVVHAAIQGRPELAL